MHLDFFQVVCGPEFALFFEVPGWDHFILRLVNSQPSFRHAALAVSTLSRHRYFAPQQDRAPILSYALQQYNSSIRELSRLDHSRQSKVIVIVASFIFVALEFLLENYDRLQSHIRSAFAILHDLVKADAPESAYLRHALLCISERAMFLIPGCS